MEWVGKKAIDSLFNNHIVLLRSVLNFAERHELSVAWDFYYPAIVIKVFVFHYLHFRFTTIWSQWLFKSVDTNNLSLFTIYSIIFTLSYILLPGIFVFTLFLECVIHIYTYFTSITHNNYHSISTKFYINRCNMFTLYSLNPTVITKL